MEGNTEQEARDCSSLGCRPPQPLIWEAFPCLDFTSLSAQALTNELNSPNPSVAIRHGCLGFFFKLGMISEVSLCTLSCSCISVIQVSSLNNHTVAIMLFTWKELCFIDGKCCNALSCQDENLKKNLFIVFAT